MWKALAVIMSLAMFAGAASAIEPESTYAIQNVQTGKNIRPFEAKKADGNRIVQYTHWSWKCMTWQFVEVGENTYQLRNLWTSKTLVPSSAPAANATLWQKPINGDDSQAWTFIKSEGDTYLVKMKTTDLYLSANGNEQNADIVLLPLRNTDAQRWRLVAQNPWF